MSQNTNAHDTSGLSFNSFASSFHRQRGLLTFHTDGQFYTGCSRPWPEGGWLGGAQPHTAVNGACGHQFACNIHTGPCAYVRSKCKHERVKAFLFFTLSCVYSPRHIASLSLNKLSQLKQ